MILSSNMTLSDFRAWCYDASLEILEAVQKQTRGEYRAVLICELKRREAWAWEAWEAAENGRQGQEATP